MSDRGCLGAAATRISTVCACPSTDDDCLWLANTAAEYARTPALGYGHGD